MAWLTRQDRDVTSAWREVALATADELRTVARWLRARHEAELVAGRGSRWRRWRRAPTRGDAGVEALINGIEVHLDEVETAASRTRGRRVGRIVAGVNGADLERAESNIAAAEALILRLAPLSYDRAIMPSLLAIVHRHLPPGDERVLRLEQIAAEDGHLTEGEADVIAAVVRDASREARREIARVRSFRNVLYVAALALTLVGAGVTLVGIFAQDALPLCFEPTQVRAGEPPEAKIVCPIREVPIESTGARTAQEAENDATDAWDVPLVQLIGLVAAAISAAVALRNIRGTATPYSLPVALAVLKLPTGALTAFLGIVLLRGGFVPGLSALDSSAQILAWALVFGYAQQLLTQFVDQQAGRVLERVHLSDPVPPRAGGEPALR